MAKKKPTKRKRARKGSKLGKETDNGEMRRMNQAKCSAKEGGIKLEAICDLGEVSACVRQLREALVMPTEEKSAGTK